jgi:hypothetical protein
MEKKSLFSNDNKRSNEPLSPTTLNSQMQLSLSLNDVIYKVILLGDS